MKIKDIQNALDNITILDDLIIKTEKALQALATKKCGVDFNMIIKPEKEPNSENVLDGDGSIKPEFKGEQETFPSNPWGISVIWAGSQQNKSEDTKHHIELNHNFMNEEVATMVLSYMLKEYKGYRKQLREGLEKIGITF
jgi:hypothetical protein